MDRDRRAKEQGDRYEWKLGRLGSWLDAVPAHRVTVTDVGYGFVARYHRPDMEPVFVERFFPDSEVAAMRPGDLRLRRRFGRWPSDRHGGVAVERGGYGDLFRALGYEMDRRSLSSCVLREEGNDLLLIVCDGQGDEQQQWFSPQDRLRLRAEARGRRAKRKRWLPGG